MGRRCRWPWVEQPTNGRLYRVLCGVGGLGWSIRPTVGSTGSCAVSVALGGAADQRSALPGFVRCRWPWVEHPTNGRLYRVLCGVGGLGWSSRPTVGSTGFCAVSVALGGASDQRSALPGLVRCRWPWVEQPTNGRLYRVLCGVGGLGWSIRPTVGSTGSCAVSVALGGAADQRSALPGFVRCRWPWVEQPTNGRLYRVLCGVGGHGWSSRPTVGSTRGAAAATPRLAASPARTRCRSRPSPRPGAGPAGARSPGRRQ